jgi:prepilin-type N-terminal cleavage/methylation domain-containing protein
MHTPNRNNGFTIIELMVVIVLVLILAALVIFTASGVRAKNRNTDRQTAINTAQAQLETYYAQTNKYPTLGNFNDAAWRAQNLTKLKAASSQDPRWSAQIPDCTANGKAVFSAKPAANCYSYQVTGSDGSPCDNTTIDCAHYTLTALLEGGERYVKSSLN